MQANYSTNFDKGDLFDIPYASSLIYVYFTVRYISYAINNDTLVNTVTIKVMGHRIRLSANYWMETISVRNIGHHWLR